MSNTQLLLLGERWECPTQSDFCLMRGESVIHTTFAWWEVRVSHTKWLLLGERWECPTLCDFCLERWECPTWRQCPKQSDFCLEGGESVQCAVTFCLVRGWECTTHNDFCLVRCESVQHTMTFVWWDCPTPSDFFLERGESVPNTVTFAHLFGDSVPHKTAIKTEWHLTLVWWPWPLLATGIPTAATVPGTGYYGTHYAVVSTGKYFIIQFRKPYQQHLRTQ
jgi:hypothetical protein